MRPTSSKCFLDLTWVTFRRPTDDDSYRLRLIPEDEYTGIGEITDNTSAQSPDTAVAYDLAGRRVSNPRHGFYIVNGEKMIMQ